ncbi:MAG TPA: FecR domain-containing protein [Chitinophaga sp.]|uniref:FecR domain-containing protein n=1 Tax=Chitinophaga sp. TaxID=1869181 RepID=UPI002CF76F44|nr:FecR domain-containing protein [Chitinophaga sp.]HVI43741.1 FecR domain-containing protein [Chitinophaga sp.]
MSHPDQQIIDLLLEKHALGICTPEECAVLERWYDAFPADGPVFENGAEKQDIRESLKAGVFGVIQQEINETATTPETVMHVAAAAETVPGNGPFRSMYWRVAAAVLVLIATGSLFFLFKSKPAPLTYTEVSAPAGRNIFHLQLPDGSAVWLEPGSRLRYANQFGEKSRNVQMIDGLAYFSVVQGASHPFTVSAAGIQAKVLGTEFSVKAYRGLPDVQVYVSSGKVQVSDSSHVLGILAAGQQIVYAQTTGTVTRMDGKQDDWRHGTIALQGVSFAEVACILQNRYEIQVGYDAAKMSPYRFTLRISANMSLAEVLEMLKDLSGLNYTLNNGHVTVTGVQQ